MMDLKALVQGINQIAEEKGVAPEAVLAAIEDSLAAAYKKEYGTKGQVIRAKLDQKTGELNFNQIKTVVDESTVRMPVEGEELAPETAKGEDEEEKLPRYSAERHVFKEEAKALVGKKKGEPQLGDEIEIHLPLHTDFGRIAAQTAKQVIIQKLREIERESIIKEYKDKEGQIVSGVVQRFERGNVFVDLGRVSAILPYNESIPGEHYRVGERLRFLIQSVATDLKTPGIILSRANPQFVAKLFELEVPEIADKIVEVKSIAREPGSRTKIAVASTVDGIDPVGSCVGTRGTRVMAVTNELGAEKLDIIEWSPAIEKFISNSLSPTKVQSVEMKNSTEALVLVADSELSLAIGKGGQNVRLAAKLTGCKIDVRSQSRPDEVKEGAVSDAIEESSGEEAPDDKPVYRKPDTDD